MDYFKIGGGGNKIDINMVGTGYSAGTDDFSGVIVVALFIRIFS